MPLVFKRKQKLTWKKITAIVSLGLLATVTLVSGGFYLLNSNNQDRVASASEVGQITLNPGQTGRFFLRYGNASPDTPIENAILNVRIGKSLAMDTSTLYQIDEDETEGLESEEVVENFSDYTKYPIQTSTGSSTGSATNQSGSNILNVNSSVYSSIITYTPASANDPSNPSGNANGTEMATLKFGYVTFEATLDPNILQKNNSITGQPYQVGDELAPRDQEGIISYVSGDNLQVQGEGRYTVIIGDGNNNGITIGPENVGTGTCEPDPQTVGTDLEYCIYQVVDENGDPILDSNTPTLPAGMTTNLDGSGPSDECTVVTVASIDGSGGGYYIKCSNVPTDGSQPGNVPATLTFPDQTEVNDKASANLVADTPTVISQENIGEGNCVPPTQLIGNNVDYCYFPLIDSNGNPLTSATLPQGNTTANIDTATGNSDNCTIVSAENLNMSGNGQYLKCDNVPTTDGNIGGQEVSLTLGDGSTAADKANVTLIDENTAQGCNNSDEDCRLYFIGLDDGEVNWQGKQRFNIDSQEGGWPRTQKFKDGNARIVFDEIKTTSGEYITDGSTCKFELYRYTMNTVIKELESQTVDGKCFVDLPADQQAINYYRVVVNAIDTEANETMKAVDTLILVIGG